MIRAVYENSGKPLRVDVRISRKRIGGETITVDSDGNRLTRTGRYDEGHALYRVDGSSGSWFYVVPDDLFCGDEHCEGWVARQVLEPVVEGRRSVIFPRTRYQIRRCDRCDVFAHDGDAAVHASRSRGTSAKYDPLTGEWFMEV